jgi:hypothetical protein
METKNKRILTALVALASLIFSGYIGYKVWGLSQSFEDAILVLTKKKTKDEVILSKGATKEDIQNIKDSTSDEVQQIKMMLLTLNNNTIAAFTDIQRKQDELALQLNDVSNSTAELYETVYHINKSFKAKTYSSYKSSGIKEFIRPEDKQIQNLSECDDWRCIFNVTPDGRFTV